MIEIQDIFNRYMKDYFNGRIFPPHISRVINSISSCRTSTLGAHIDECNECGHIRISYNSCRNRHCPKCQGLAKEKWIHARKKELLDTQYFHIVFTIPSQLYDISLINQKEIYSMLFKAVSETLLDTAKDKKYLAANIGFTCILHTWGQNLMYHPHIHCIVPGGGLSLDGTRWISSKKKFFIHVKILSSEFKKRFIKYLKVAYYSNKLKFTGKIEDLSFKYVFQNFVGKLLGLQWVVFSKPTFKKPQHVIEYLGNYTHRVAISNSRIISLENDNVTFKWKDYMDNDKIKLMTIPATEFIRRFLLHILPHKFVKIRHYGILSNKNKKAKIELCRRLIATAFNKEIFRLHVSEISTKDLIFKLTGKDISICPCCNRKAMVRKTVSYPRILSPPKTLTSS